MLKNPILKEVAQKAFADYKEKLLNKPATRFNTPGLFSTSNDKTSLSMI